MNAAGLIGVAQPTVERFGKRATRLYEQGALARLGEYVRRWLIRVKSGLQDAIDNVAFALGQFQYSIRESVPRLQD